MSEVIDLAVCGEFPEIAVRKGTGLVYAVVDVKRVLAELLVSTEKHKPVCVIIKVTTYSYAICYPNNFNMDQVHTNFFDNIIGFMQRCL